jgi:hypothetical protein
MFMANIAQVACREAQEKVDAERKQKENKYVYYHRYWMKSSPTDNSLFIVFHV